MDSNKQLIEMIKYLLKEFRFERWIYNISTIIAICALVYCTCYLVTNNELDKALLFGLFGSTGVVTVTCGLILRMWSDAMKLIRQHFKK